MANNNNKDIGYYAKASLAAGVQFEGMKAIPEALLANWPAFFGFYAVETLYAMVLRMVPQFGGAVGTIENAALAGATEVLRFVTWEKLRTVAH